MLLLIIKGIYYYPSIHRKVVIKCILIVAAFFHLLIAILPLMSLNKNASEILNLYEKLVYTIIMMVLVMCRMTLSFGFGFINVILNIYYYIGLCIRSIPNIITTLWLLCIGVPY